MTFILKQELFSTNISWCFKSFS